MNAIIADLTAQNAALKKALKAEKDAARAKNLKIKSAVKSLLKSAEEKFAQWLDEHDEVGPKFYFERNVG